jgi:hypothetical protein
MSAGDRDRPPALRVGITMVGGPGDRLLDAAASGRWVDVAGHAVAVLPMPRLEGQTDLTVEISRSSDRQTVAFRYDLDLFAEATVRSLLERFARFIALTADRPDALVGRVPLVDDAGEVDRLLALGDGRPGADGSPDPSVPSRLAV